MNTASAPGSPASCSRSSAHGGDGDSVPAETRGSCHSSSASRASRSACCSSASIVARTGGRSRRTLPRGTEGGQAGRASRPRKSRSSVRTRCARTDDVGYFVGFIAAVLVFGFYVSVPVMLVSFLRRQAEASWRFALLLGGGGDAVLYLMFGVAPAHPLCIPAS